MLNTLRTGRPLKLAAGYEILEEPHVQQLVGISVEVLRGICIIFGGISKSFLVFGVNHAQSRGSTRPEYPECARR